MFDFVHHSFSDVNPAEFLQAFVASGITLKSKLPDAFADGAVAFVKLQTETTGRAAGLSSSDGSSELKATMRSACIRSV